MENTETEWNPGPAYNPGENDFAESDQDRVINQLIFDSDFLQRCKRKGLEADLFTSEIRRQFATYILNFHDRYKEAPYDQIIDILSPNNGIGVRVREDNIPAMQDYLEHVVSLTNSPGRTKRLYDKMEEFINRRIILNSINRLNKSKERIDGSTAQLKKIIDDAACRLNVTCESDKTLGIFDEVEFDQEPWLTRFNIPALDNAYGGGLSTPNLVLLQAFTGRGKTWSICHLAKIGLRMGNDVIAFVTEMNSKKFLGRMRQTLTGLTPSEIRYNIEKAREILEKSLVRGSKFHLISEQVRLDTDFSVDSIESIVKSKEDQRGVPQKVILIDSPDDLSPPRGFGSSRTTEIDKSKAIWTWLRNYSHQNDKLIVATSQSQRKVESVLWTTSGNIGEDINKSRRSTLGISLNGYKTEVEAGFLRLLIFKNTYGPDMRAAWIETDFEHGMFEKNSGEIKGLKIDQYKNMLIQRGIKFSAGAEVGS